MFIEETLPRWVAIRTGLAWREEMRGIVMGLWEKKNLNSLATSI
jgi:hypothetical protein